MPRSRTASFSATSKLRRSFSFTRKNSFRRTRSFWKAPDNANSNSKSLFSRLWFRQQKPNQVPPQWLDELPLEVCERIAAHMSNGLPTRDLLHFGQTSPKLGLAVSNALQNKLSVKLSCPDDVIHGFVDLMQDRVIEVDIIQIKINYVARLVKSQQLRVARISDWRISALAMSNSLRELYLQVQALVPRNLLLRILATFPLSKLTVTCTHNRPSRCPFHKPHLFARACPGLVSFAALCNCEPDDPAPWRVLPWLHNLRELHVFGDVPQRWFPMVSLLESVKVSGRSAYATAVTLGPPVRELNLLVGGLTLNAEDLIMLQRCSLTVLRARLNANAEATLLQVCQKSHQLRVLDLQWNCGLQGPAHCKYYGLCYSEMMTGVLPRSIAMLPALAELKLLNVRMSLFELTEVMRSIGGRLRVFATSIADQKEGPFERLMKVVEAGAMYNPELREFFVSESLPAFPFGAFVLVGRYEKLKRLKEEGRMIDGAVQRLKVRAPYLNTKFLDSVTQLLLQDRYHLIANNEQVRVDPVTRW